VRHGETSHSRHERRFCIFTAPDIAHISISAFHCNLHKSFWRRRNGNETFELIFTWEGRVARWYIFKPKIPLWVIFGVP
jgi:hypothetical protein